MPISYSTKKISIHATDTFPTSDTFPTTHTFATAVIDTIFCRGGEDMFSTMGALKMNECIFSFSF